MSFAPPHPTMFKRLAGRKAASRGLGAVGVGGVANDRAWRFSKPAEIIYQLNNMNTNILDKAIKIRHILILFVIVLFFSFIYYVCSFFMVGLLHHHGGGYSLNSPYAKFFPDNCKKYTDVSGAFQVETFNDGLLLKTRYRRIKINNPALDYSSASHMTCLGYTVMGGLHEGSVGAANFTHEFQNAKGEPIATVQVKYHKAHPYPATDLIEELKVNSK